MKLFEPVHWKEYQLLDAGNFRKLEQFGPYVTIRPEPQAVWQPFWDEQQWRKKAHVEFVQRGSNAGDWNRFRDMPDRWMLKYDHAGLHLQFRLALTGFKHVGVFPEQAANWDFIYDSVSRLPVEQPKVLNLFAYTGGASLAAKAAGADVVHVDSIKQVVSWARDNMELSGLSDIRWTVEDAMAFVKREIRRGKKYHGIMLDPPAFGHGAKGERWKLEDSIDELLADTAELLHPDHHFYILNTYSLGFSYIIVENLFRQHFPKARNLELGELFTPAQSGCKLPLGVIARFRS